jgi:hypothetical protein
LYPLGGNLVSNLCIGEGKKSIEKGAGNIVHTRQQDQGNGKNDPGQFREIFFYSYNPVKIRAGYRSRGKPAVRNRRIVP